MTLDIWHQYLICCTWHLIPDTWYMTLDDWHAITYLTCFHMELAHLTWYCDTWLDTSTPDTCITLHIHDYHFYGDLAWLLYCYQTSGTPELLCSCAPELLYSWTPITGRLLTLCSWYYTLVDPRNWIIIDIRLLWTPCGHYHWTIFNNWTTYTGNGELMSMSIGSMFMMVL